MKVAILTLASFPEGLAITNRVFYYAKGLKENGINVKVFVVKPTEIIGKVANADVSGSRDGVDYIYTVKSPVRSSSFFARRYYDIMGPVFAAFKVITGRYDSAILVSSDSFYHAFLFKFIFALSGIKFGVERTELMFHAKKTSGIFKLINKFFEKTVYRGLDVFYTISYVLQEDYKSYVSKKTPVVLIPVIVDEKDIYRPEIERTENIVYTGPLVQRKDGILFIIESFNAIAADFPNVNLIMTGDINMTWDKEKIQKLVDASPYKHRMVFKGFVTRKEMVELLNSAAALVLAKPTGDQSDTCFPTKLGEYLSSANPIVVTRTGEIPLYLEDGKNAYIAEPDSVESFTQKLRELFSDKKKAREIGEEGRRLAISKFNYVEISKTVIKSLESVK